MQLERPTAHAGGTVVCVGAGTAVVFESVRITGATIVATNQAHVTLSRCTLADCPVGVLTQGRGAAAALRRCTAHGCAAVAVAAGGATATLTDVVATMPRAGGVAVDARGTGTRVHAAGVVIQAPDGDGSEQPALRDAGFRGRDGATLEMADCTVSQCMGGVDLGGVGTVGEAKGCKVQGSVRAGVVVRGGAAGDLQRCSVTAAGGQGIVVEGLGSNVAAVECRVHRAAGDAVAAAAGAAMRVHSCHLSESAGGCGAAAAGGGSVVALHACTLEGHASGLRVADGGMVRAEDTTISRCVTGAGAHVEGEGSVLQLEGCHISAASGDGVAAEGGGIVDGRRMRVRTVGVAGGAVGAGSCVRVTGPGSVVRMHESSLSRGAGGNVLAELGGEAVLQGCEVTAAVAGGAMHAVGRGTRVVLSKCRVYANAGGGGGVADGALVSATGSNIADGMHASGQGSRLALNACEVRGVVVHSAGAEVVADACSFEVKPRAADSLGGAASLTECRWGREETGPGGGGVMPRLHSSGQNEGDSFGPLLPLAPVALAIADADTAIPVAGAAAVSAAGDSRRHVFRVAEEDGPGSGEGLEGLAGGVGGGLRVGDLPAAYAPGAAEAAQAEVTLAPSMHARGAAERRDSGAARRRRHIFGPSSDDEHGAVHHSPAVLSTVAGSARGGPWHGEPAGTALSRSVNPDGAGAHSRAADSAALVADRVAALPALPPSPEGSRPAPAPGAAARPSVTAAAPSGAPGRGSVADRAAVMAEGAPLEVAGDGIGSSRAALRWLRVAGRHRSTPRGAAAGNAAIGGVAATQPAPPAGISVSVSEAAAAAAAAYVATAARRQASEVTARAADVRPLLLRTPGSGGRAPEAGIPDSRGGSTDLMDSGAESVGLEERPLRVLRAPMNSSAGARASAGAGEGGGEGRRRSGLMRALQRVRRGRRSTTTAPDSAQAPGSG